MKTTLAECKINGLEITTADIKRGSDRRPAMMAEYVLLGVPENEPALLHGKQQAVPNNWSPRTQELLKELVDSMEIDLMSFHFEVEKQEASNAPRFESGEFEETPQV